MTHEREKPERERAKPRMQREGPSLQPAVDAPALAPAGLAALSGVGNRALLSLWRSGALQRKARVSEPGDALEREADRVADAVVADAPGLLTAQPHAGSGVDVGLQAKPTGSSQASVASDDLRSLLGDADAGLPLPDGVRGFMESRFQTSFEDVRIHAGERSAQAALSVAARAFTIGSEIVFGAGEFAVESTAGRRLLAHELSHVVQQRPATSGAPRERASSAASGVKARGASDEVQRAPKESPQAGAPILSMQFDTVFVNFHRMAAPITTGESRAALFLTSQHWDPGQRVFRLSFDNINRMSGWQRAPNAERDARADNITVILSATDYFGKVRPVVIGAKAPNKPVPPKPDTPPPDTPNPPPETEDTQPAIPKRREASGEAPHGGVTKVERESLTDPKRALDHAAALPPHELRELGPAPRTRLLDAAADRSAASVPSALVHDLIQTTPDADAGTLADTLHADGDKLLNDLRHAQPDARSADAIDAAAKDLDARRRDRAPADDGHDYVDWTPELQKKADEVRKAMQRIGSRKPDVNESMEGRPEWDDFKGRQKSDLERELRNVEGDVTRWNASHTLPGQGNLDDSSGIGAKAHDEVAQALEKVRTAKTISELFEARKAAKLALFRANEAMDAKRKLEQFESGVRLWNETQSGWAAFASVPSHGLAGASFDRPDQIAAQARTEIRAGLDDMQAARTPEEVAAAATRLRKAMSDANFYLDYHKDQVYGGAEKTIVGIKVVGVTAAAIVAPEYVIPGFVIGGGLGVARQHVEMSEGTRKEFDASEAFDTAVVGGFAAPFAVGIPVVGYGMVGLGLGSAAGEYSEGHWRTGTFDLVTSLAPLGLKAAGGKGLLPTGKSLRSGALALTLRGVGAGFEDVPGLGGRNPTVSIPYEQSSGLYAPSGNSAPPSVTPMFEGVPSLGGAADPRVPTYNTWKPGGTGLPTYELPRFRLSMPGDPTVNPSVAAPDPQLRLFDLGPPTNAAPAPVDTVPRFNPVDDPAFAPRFEGDSLRVPRQLSLYDIRPSMRGSGKTGNAASREWNNLMKFLYKFEPKPNSTLEINGNRYSFDAEGRLVEVTSDKNMASFNRPEEAPRWERGYADARKIAGYDYGHVAGVESFGNNDMLLQERGGFPQEANFNRTGAWRQAEAALTNTALRLQADGKVFRKTVQVRNFVDGVPSEWRAMVTVEGAAVPEYDSGWLSAPMPAAPATGSP
jgi:hypothetical protein